MTVRGYLMSTPMDPQAQPVSNTYRWATVTDNDPLEIVFDGDSLPLATIPDCLCDPLTLGVGDRVWTQLYGRKVIVHGAQGGGLGPHNLPNEKVAWLVPSSTATTASGSFVDWPNAGGGPLAVTHVKRLASSVLVASVAAGGAFSGIDSWTDFAVNIDGADVLVIHVFNNQTDHTQWSAMRALTGYAAGSRVITLRARTSGVTLSATDGTTYSLSIREVAP